jgi:hypothetical protein
LEIFPSNQAKLHFIWFAEGLKIEIWDIGTTGICLDCGEDSILCNDGGMLWLDPNGKNNPNPLLFSSFS